uniref:LEM domain-containing protein n=1 Tax=Leptobrachium leishanense TaxID=445787 RepID=A0A8C5P8P6_9ANUR
MAVRSMESLAQRLCEAVENEDTKEVEALLKRGANPNLVLPNGVAAIHLASGKENESALRCLGLILQHGGDPNVRSMEELTPVHVAASWGCCKALVALLRRGGDPTLQDQDGNTASDLALNEQNRRSVVTLQEYMERNADGAWADRNYGDGTNKTYDDITQISCISLLLEAPCDNSVLSSTRLSSLSYLEERANVGKRIMDNAVIQSQVDLLSLDADDELKYKEPDQLSKRGSFTSCKILPSMKPNKLSSDHVDCKMSNFEQLPSTQALSAHCCVADSSRFLKGDVHYLKAMDLHFVQEQQFTVPINGHKVIDRFCFAKNDFSKRAQVDGGDIVVMNSNVCMDPKINSWKMSGLDVTSPDHVFIYNRGTTKEADLEETLIMTDHDMHEDLGDDQHESCSSNYNSCQSDCSPNIMEGSNVNGESNFKSQEIQLSQVNDGRQSPNAICKGRKTSLEEKSSRTVNMQVSSQECTPLLPEKNTWNLGNRCTEMCTPQLNHHTEETGPKTVTPHENRIQLAEPLRRDTEVPCIDQSSTLISVRDNADLSITQGILSNESQTQLVGLSQSITGETCTGQSSIIKTGRGDDDYKNDHQDLRSRLRHMMLLTKACASKLLKDTQPVQNNDLSQGSASDTIPVKPEEMSEEEQSQVISEKLKATMLLTKRQQSCTVSAAPDTLAVETDALVQENWDTELRAKLRNLMLSTKEFPVLSIGDEGKEKPHCFFTPRTKSRLNSSSRHSNSSLFDETIEMPQRGMRVRSPDSTLRSPLPNTSRIVSSEKKSGNCELNGLKVQSVVSVNQGEKNQSTLLKAEEIVNVSDFLTDDLSTESETTLCGSHLKEKQRVPVVEYSGNTWLTEDGEESSVGCPKEHPINGPLQGGYQFPGSCYNGSLVHSTLLEDPVVKSRSYAKPRYSFSRLSCIVTPKELRNPCQQKQISYPAAEVVPLSPGGRPVNESRDEPVDYLYLDGDKGHSLIERHVPCMDTTSRDLAMDIVDTILYDWREYKTSTQAVCPTLPNRVAVELYRLSNAELARRLMEVGEDNCEPVTSQNRKSYIKLLDKRLKEHAGKRNKGFTGTTGHSPELSLAIHTFDVPDCNSDEAVLSLEFDQPDKTRKWREGILKCSFNYLLMDPRVSQNLPSRCNNISERECFRTFVSSIFYVGKGKRSRPYSHLYEALTHYKGSSKQMCSKVQHILDIWKSGLGVISLHCFQNTIPVEAYTREACLVDAIGLKMITNQKKGVYYGQMHNWNPTRQRRLGVHMLYKAMQIFLAEGERQLRPPDIHSK